ncbi:hypothetical protein E2C01_009539 [Portunus trituberculatus]|uniref:Uncharacterized protein n=1 Tax=Portunus trituberculatus TaxID=210409 RepID=A0A5B7D623_PORTR|nr:hypothetical protein [Portunus trituberculatus]
MAAPQQHPLTNTSCSFSSPAVFSPAAGSYGSGKTPFCGDLHGQVSVASDCNVQSLVCSSATVSPQPILTNSASRKTKPCSLCGTAALRSQSSLIPNSPVSPQEQPVVLLHRLEDGLPEGDVDSLRAFGTIRLLPVHCGKVEGVTDDSKHKCDRKFQSVTSHAMAPGNLAYRSFKRGNTKKRLELPSVSQGYGDRNKSLTNDILRKFKASDSQHNLSEKKIKSNTNSDSGGTSHRVKNSSEAHVNENSVGNILISGEETLGERLKTLSSQQNHPQYSTVSTVSSVSQSLHRVSSHQHQTLSPQADTLERSSTSRSPLSSLNNLLSPQTSTSSTVNSHSHDSTSLAHSTQDSIHQRSVTPDTQMSVVCSPVLPLTTAAISSPSQNIDSPSTISPPESPPSPPSPFSPAFMGSPSTCDHDNLHSSCSADVQPSSSPYSPCTLPSLPASPTSLPSSSPPSPTHSVDSPPVSPATCENSDSQVPFPETLGGDPLAENTDSEVQLDTLLKSKVDFELGETRVSEVVSQYHLNRTCQKEVAHVPSASETEPALSAQIYIPEDTSTVSQNSETEAHADLYQEASTDYECGDRKNSLEEVEHLKPDVVKISLNSESNSENKNKEAEKNCSDSKNSLMKLVLKVKHPANQQLPVGPEKKEYNKENGIPKIVLTWKGNGPNKEYSCSNRLRNESESCSGESVYNKKHKSKRNKRQKPKDREKMKRVIKVGKHKRHVELFGEDSNDSCDIIHDNIDTSEGGHSTTASIDEQRLRPFFTPCATEDVPSFPDERNLAPTLSLGESPSHCAKFEESAETADTFNLSEQSLPHSLPSDVPDVNTDIKDMTKSSIEDTEGTTENQPECTENYTHETLNLTAEVPETRGDEPSCMELQPEGKETSQASPGTRHSGEIDQQDKQSEGLTLRSRRSRHVKNTESGRNSDTCLWVSFGVNAPMPLPATDLPSLEPVFTSREKTKLRESEINDSKEHISSNQPKVEVKKPFSKATHKERKEKEKTETQPDTTKQFTEHDYESKAKFLIKHIDSKTVVSHSHRKVHSTSSHDDNYGAHGNGRSYGVSTHHRSRHSHKRQRKSDDDREEAVTKEISSRQQNSLDGPERDDNGSQVNSIKSDKEKSATSHFTTDYGPDDVQMKTEEISSAKELCPLLNPSSSVDDSKEDHKKSPNNISSHEENEVNVKPEKLVNLKTEETSDDQYYRPKKMRKAFNNRITTNHHNESASIDQKTTKHQTDEKTVTDQPEDCNAQVSLKFSSSEVVTTTYSSGMHTVESESSMVECHTAEVKTDVPWRPHEEITKPDVLSRSPNNSETSNEQRKRKHPSPTPQGQDLVTRVGVESVDEQSKQATEGRKEEASDKSVSFKKDTSPNSEDNENKEASKKEKEKRKKPRKEKRKDGSRPGSRCAVLQEAQFRREVEHEGRGRRLAQEIKGFNWLEQKIKNNSLLSSRAVPSTPTTSSSGKELESPSKSVSSTPTAPSSQFTFSSKDEEQARKNSFSGSSSNIGFKRHLQTAVPPLIPSSKVTALPKRRPSLGTTTPPCSAPPALCSTTTVPSMTVPGTLYTCEPTLYRSGHGRVPPPLEKSSTSLEHAEGDKATLYSSTSSTKATLYGVKDNSFEALYDTVNVNAVKYYGSVASGDIDPQYNITTTPPICFYGSTKYQEPDLHPDKTPPTGSHAKSSIISTPQDSGGMTDHQADKICSPKPDTCSARNSDWSAQQGSSPNSQHSGCSAGPHSPQRFSHKQTLLRRAFQEMMKSDSNNSSTEQTKEKESVIQSNPTKTEMNMADESKSKEMETPGSTTAQSSSERTSSVDIKSIKSQCPDITPSLSLSKWPSEPTESHIFSYSPKSIATPINSEKDVIDPVCTENKISTSSTNIQEGAENVASKIDLNKKIVMTENNPNIKENDSDKQTSLGKINNDKNMKIPENSKDLQSDVIDCIGSESGDIDMKVLKEEICYKGDGKSQEDAEVQPRLLLSVLYKELMKTRQEVEKLRKVQELMLTEKEEKKEDGGEQSSETKIECEKADENSHSNERNSEKRKDHESSDVELKIDDDDECHFHESKRSKISIRSDLLPREDNVDLDTTSHNTSVSQKIISHSHQISSATLKNLTQVQSNLEISMTSLKGSSVPETSHASQVNPAMPAVSPGLSSSIAISPNTTTPLLRGHSSASPGVSSPGIPRSSPGIPRPSPPITRTSPGITKSNSGSIIVSPGGSISPAMPSSSPGIARNSPGVPQNSPGVLRMSPGLPRIHCGIPRISPGGPLVSPVARVVSPATSVISPGAPMASPGAPMASPGVPMASPGAPMASPGAPMTSPGRPMASPGRPMASPGRPIASPGVSVVSPGSSRNGLGLIRNDSEVTIVNPGILHMSPSSSQGNVFSTPTNPSSAEDLHMSYSDPAVTTAQPKVTTIQTVTSPVVPVPRFPQIPITSTAVPVISPTGGKRNPITSKIDQAATTSLKKTTTPLTNMSPTKLRSVFGISNSEVELMPVSVEPKQTLHEPQPRTFLNLIEDQHHQTTEMPLLLSAVQGVHQESGSKNVESSSSHGAVPFHSLAGHEDLKRISKAHQYPGEIKRHALSTSDLPDHASSACKQPPPLKPATTLLRRHSDNMDIHSAMHHHAMYGGTRKNSTSSLHSSAAVAEHKNANAAHPFNHPQYSPTQYPLPNPRGRRNTDTNSTERNRGYQQAVSMGMQHQFPHLPSGSSVMRSLGPDKATIFPITPTMPAAIRPFRPSALPPATRAQLEQLQNENFYRTNFSFFEKIREKFAQPCDNGVSAMDRLQASTANVEKPMQPQTFAPRVLVRESIPEAHTPTTSYTTMHFPNQNQPAHNVMPSHQNHFSTNMHSGPSLQHLAQARLHNQATSSMQRVNSSSLRSGEKLCFHCSQQARFICSGCKKAWYCSEQCQYE